MPEVSTMDTPLRTVAPRVGLATRWRPKDAMMTPATAGATGSYDARIMRNPVPATLLEWEVVADASDAALAQAMRVAECEVRAKWLTSRTPLVDPRPSPAPAVDAPAPRYRERARAPPVPLFVLQSYRDLAVELRLRLQALGEDTQAPPPAVRRKDRYYAKAPPAALSIEGDSTSAESAPSGVGSFEPTCHMARSRPAQPDLLLGKYMAHGTEADSLVRVAGGLYSGVRHSRGVALGECAYAEMYVQYAGGQGGIALGAAVARFALDTMVGSKAGSVALHSEARVVRAGHWGALDMAHAKYGTGDTVGIYVAISARGRIAVRTWVNGQLAADIAGDEAMRQAALDGERIHVQAALLRPGARIALRCLSHEWRFAPHDIRAAPLSKPHRHAPSDVGSQVLTP